MNLPIRISEESREPIYHQIETQVIALIMGGQLQPGSPLPSIRALANDLSCSVITTRRAYQNLESQGFIKTLQGKGTFVREIEAKRKEDTKKRIVYDAFEKAIEQGVQVGFSVEEIHAIFEQVLNRYQEIKE